METIVMQAHSGGGAGSDDGVPRSRLIGGDPLYVGARRSFGMPAELVEINFQAHHPTLVELIVGTRCSSGLVISPSALRATRV